MCQWPKDNPNSCGEWSQFVKDPTAWVDFCSTFHTHAEATWFPLIVPREQKPANISAKLKQRLACPEWEPDPRCSLTAIREAEEMSKGAPETNPCQQEIKSNVLQPALIRHVQVIGVPHCWWQLFNFHLKSWKTPKSTGYGKNTPHWPEVVKLPLFDTNKKHPVSNTGGWGMAASSEVFKSTNSFLICAHLPISQFDWETPCTRTSCSSGTSLTFVVLMHIFYLI